MLDNISLAADAATLSPVALFLQADIIVKAVMIGLLLASIYVWAVIFTHGRGVGKLMRASDQFERDFWRADNIDRFFDKNGAEELPSAKVLSAGISEWRRSTKGKIVDRDGTRERLGIAMNSAVAGEVDRLAEKIGTLATLQHKYDGITDHVHLELYDAGKRIDAEQVIVAVEVPATRG